MSYIGVLPTDPQATVERYHHTAVGGETSITVRAYTASLVEVYVNGVKFADGIDFQAANGSDITFAVALAAGDYVEVMTWLPFRSANQLARQRYEFVATSAGQTYTGLSYSVGSVSVVRNGFTLPTTDFTAGDGVSITVPSVAVGDDIIIEAYVTFDVADVYTKTEVDNQIANIDLSTKLDNTGIPTINDAAGGLTGLNFTGSAAGATNFALRQGWVGVQNEGIAIRDLAANADRLRIDSSGRVTTPYQPKCQVYNAPRYSGTNSVLVFASVAYNVGSHYNVSNGLFTAPTTGYYRMNAGAMKGNSGQTGIYVELRPIINGAVQNIARAYSWNSDSGYGNTNLVCIVYLNANDTLGCHSSSNGSGVYHDGYSNMSIELIG